MSNEWRFYLSKSGNLVNRERKSPDVRNVKFRPGVPSVVLYVDNIHIGVHNVKYYLK